LSNVFGITAEQHPADALSNLALALLSILDMMGSFALAGLCGTAVSFMLLFLRALLREVMRPRSRLIVKGKVAAAAPVSIEQSSTRLDRAA